MRNSHFAIVLLVLLLSVSIHRACAALNELSSRRAVLQTSFGDLHLGFYPRAAPKTTALITELLRLGCYNTNHFFRVDKGFVAQVAGVEGNVLYELNEEQRKYARQTVPLEVHAELKHDRAGLLSLARHDDPNSGGSSFSIMLGPAPHLDMNYAIFGEVTKGLETLRSMEAVETTRDGIFVMPVERITIHSTYMYDEPTGVEPNATLESTVKEGEETKEGLAKGSSAAPSCAADIVSALKAVRQELV